jgi:hypothetical protein
VTDLSPALRGENHSVFLNLSSEPRAPHGRKGALPTALSMRPASPFTNGLAAASQLCGPRPLTSKPASAFLIVRLANFCLGTTVFPIGHLPDVATQSSRPERHAVCGSEWRDRGKASAKRKPMEPLRFRRLDLSRLFSSRKTKSAPRDRSAFPISIFYLLNSKLSESPATLPWCSPTSALSCTPAN